MIVLRLLVVFSLVALAKGQQAFDELLPILRQQGAAEQLAAMQRFAGRSDAVEAIAPLLERIRAEAPALDNDGCLALEHILRAHDDAACDCDVLLEVLARPIWNSRQKAAQALEVLLRDAGTVAAHRERLARVLIPLLTSQRSRVHRAASRCLVHVAGEQFDGDAVAARRWYHATFGRGLDLQAAVHERVVVLRPVEGGGYRTDATGERVLADAPALAASLRVLRDQAVAVGLSLAVVLQGADQVLARLLEGASPGEGDGINSIHGLLAVMKELGLSELTVAPASDEFRAPFVEPGVAVELQQQLERRLAALAEHRVPGAQAAVVMPDGTLVSLVHGVADRDTKSAMSSDGRMLAGSTGKTFYMALLLQLVQEGRLGLDDRLAEHLGGREWYARLPNAAEVTLRQLAMHRSGVMRYEFAPEFLATLTERPDHLFTPEEEVAFVLDKQPRFAAGEGFDYSDTNYVLLGMVIEQVTGETCREQVARRLLTPLRLADTVPSVGCRIERLLQGYAGEHNGFGGRDAMLVDGAMPFDPGFEGAGGGYASSARDLARWCKALCEGEVLGRLRQEALLGEPAPFGPGSRYGLGIMIDRTELGPALGHSGFFPGWLSAMRYFPDAGIAVAVMVNSSAEPRLGTELTGWATALAKIASGR